MNPIDRREFLRVTGQYGLAGLGLAVFSPLLLPGCRHGQFDSSMFESIYKVGKAFAKTFEDFTPEQEYYIGRTVSAMILDTYPPYKNKRKNHYLNLLGQTLAHCSDLPETFGGYHFQIQDSKDINAFAAPGGFVFVTRGLIRCCETEDALAAVLAHEIGHVQHRHGLQAIKKSRVIQAVTTLGIETTKQLADQELADLAANFEDSIKDITHTLIQNGYSRAFELEADQAAVEIVNRVGYDPNGLVDMLNVMKQKLKPGGRDFAKTHPSPDDRIAEIKARIGPYQEVKPPRARKRRFGAFLKKI